MAIEFTVFERKASLPDSCEQRVNTLTEAGCICKWLRPDRRAGFFGTRIGRRNASAGRALGRRTSTRSTRPGKRLGSAVSSLRKAATRQNGFAAGRARPLASCLARRWKNTSTAKSPSWKASNRDRELRRYHFFSQVPDFTALPIKSLDQNAKNKALATWAGRLEAKPGRRLLDRSHPPLRRDGQAAAPQARRRRCRAPRGDAVARRAELL